MYTDVYKQQEKITQHREGKDEYRVPVKLNP